MDAITNTDRQKVIELCFNDPVKACALAQQIINTLGIVSCKTYANYKNKSVRSIQYQSGDLLSIKLDGRVFPSINQNA